LELPACVAAAGKRSQDPSKDAIAIGLANEHELDAGHELADRR
jgi:hypothetical protein